MHKDIGYNYRMTNLQAAVGHAQFQKIEQIIARKREIAGYYSDRFARVEGLRLPAEKPYARNVYWMYHLVLSGHNRERRVEVMRKLTDAGIEVISANTDGVTSAVTQNQRPIYDALCKEWERLFQFQFEYNFYASCQKYVL